MALATQPLSPIPAYVFGTVFLGIGLQGFIRPAAAYDLFGVPLGSLSPEKSHPAATSTASPFVYAKAARDISIGLAYFALQVSGDALSVTAFSAAVAVSGFLDGWVVWTSSNGAPRKKAWNHWIGNAVLSLWIALRVLKHRRGGDAHALK